VLVLVPLRVLVVIVWNFLPTTTFELSVGAGAGDRTKKRPTNSVTTTMMRTMTRYRQRQRGWSQKLCAFFMKFMIILYCPAEVIVSNFMGDSAKRFLVPPFIRLSLYEKVITMKMFWACPPPPRTPSGGSDLSRTLCVNLNPNNSR
jgi:hypothetical protein